MATQSLNVNSAAAILNRVIDPDEPTLSADAARSILALGFDPSDMDRINCLAAQARAGSLTQEEDSEFNDYLHVGRFLALIQAKARRSLQHSGAST